jgi:hypothetical protein
VLGFTTGSRGKVPGKTCEKRIKKNNNTKKNASAVFSTKYFFYIPPVLLVCRRTATHWLPPVRCDMHL